MRTACAGTKAGLQVRGSQASLEALRRAAEDARSVLEEVYDDEAVDSFKAALPWAFAGQAPRRFRARAGAVSMMAGLAGIYEKLAVIQCSYVVAVA